MKMEKEKISSSALRLLLFAGAALLALMGMFHAATGINLSYFWLALAIPIFILAIAFMASYAFSIPSLRAVLQDELLQIIATGAIALTLVGTQLVVDEYAVVVLQGAGSGAANIGGALGAASSKLDLLQNETIKTLENFQNVSIILGQEASKGVFCNFMGTGFSISSCSPFNAYRGSLTAASFTTTVALSDTYAQSFILSLARAYSFTILIPLGLLLRCFKASRSAGGALIAVGFGFYTVYPVVILATDNLLHGSTPKSPPQIPTMVEVDGVGACDPLESDIFLSLTKFNAYGDKLTSYVPVKNLAYFVLVRVLFLSILNLIITLSFIRAFAHMIGSEIDVSALARIS